MKPSKANIKKWCAALRSGKFGQTQLTLQDDVGYCCLGVACDVFIPTHLQERMDDALYGVVPGNQEHSPDWLVKINQDFRFLTEYKLATLNDEMRLSFDEIADLLEAVYIHEVLEV